MSEGVLFSRLLKGFISGPLYLGMLRKGLQLKTITLLVFFLWLVFEKLVNNRIVDHLEKCGLFSDFQYGFRSSQSTTDLLTVISDRIGFLTGLGLLKLRHLMYPKL